MQCIKSKKRHETRNDEEIIIIKRQRILYWTILRYDNKKNYRIAFFSPCNFSANAVRHPSPTADCYISNELLLPLYISFYYSIIHGHE